MLSHLHIYFRISEIICALTFCASPLPAVMSHWRPQKNPQIYSCWSAIIRLPFFVAALAYAYTAAEMTYLMSLIYPLLLLCTYRFTVPKLNCPSKLKNGECAHTTRARRDNSFYFLGNIFLFHWQFSVLTTRAVNYFWGPSSPSVPALAGYVRRWTIPYQK